MTRWDCARIVAVGDELLRGAHPDLNSPVLAAALASAGIPVRGVAVVSDAEEEIEGAVRAGLQPSGLVVLTGGLGPTLDDVTREGVAAALELELEESPGARRDLEDLFASRGVLPNEANLRQVRFPKGARILANRVGTAPGFLVETPKGAVAVLPGPPREMRVVLEDELAPLFDERSAGGVHERRFHLFGLAESLFAERVGDRMARGREPLIGCTVKRGVLSVVVSGRDVIAVEECTTWFRTEFEAHLFSEQENRLESVLSNRLRDAGLTFATAESCTGGLVASLMTSCPGSSAIFREGFVTYSNEAKSQRLGVPESLLKEHGAVSEPVARAMARGAAAASGARLSVATTGIAGPGGGSPEKPVGLVHFATSLDGAVRAEMRSFPDLGRRWIRDVAARTALYLALRRLDGTPASVGDAAPSRSK